MYYPSYTEDQRNAYSAYYIPHPPVAAPTYHAQPHLPFNYVTPAFHGPPAPQPEAPATPPTKARKRSASSALRWRMVDEKQMKEKRYRTPAHLVKRKFVCTEPGCRLSYSRLQHLNTHRKLIHGIYRLGRDEYAEIQRALDDTAAGTSNAASGSAPAPTPAPQTTSRKRPAPIDDDDDEEDLAVVPPPPIRRRLTPPTPCAAPAPARPIAGPSAAASILPALTFATPAASYPTPPASPSATASPASAVAYPDAAPTPVDATTAVPTVVAYGRRATPPLLDFTRASYDDAAALPVVTSSGAGDMYSALLHALDKGLPLDFLSLPQLGDLFPGPQQVQGNDAAWLWDVCGSVQDVHEGA